MEWDWAYCMKWDGKQVARAIGGCKKDGNGDWTEQENVKLAREAVSIEHLHKQAPDRIHKMLLAVMAERRESGAAVEESEIDVEHIRELYRTANMTTANLLGLRLYTVRATQRAAPRCARGSDFDSLTLVRRPPGSPIRVL